MAEGYKTPQKIFPTNDTTQTVATSPTVQPTKSKLKRSRSDNDEEEEEDEANAVPKMITPVTSFNSYTTEEGDWQEPDWLLPKEEACADVEMKDAN